MMLVESVCFVLKSSLGEQNDLPEEFDFLSAFSRPLNLDIRTVHPEELVEEFTEGVAMPSWLALRHVKVIRLPFPSISYLARLEYVIDDLDPTYSHEKVAAFCDHLLWALSSREEKLGLRYFVASKRLTSH